MLAGETWTTPALTILSMTDSETLEDAAPTITLTPACSRRSTVWVAVSVDVSPESPWLYSTGLPSTPPALLISSIAYSTPANSGGPRKARLPVSGSRVPILRTPSPARSASTGLTGRALNSSLASTVLNVSCSGSSRLSSPYTWTAYEPRIGSPLPDMSVAPETPS